jgi:hypothetical protein
MFLAHLCLLGFVLLMNAMPFIRPFSGEEAAIEERILQNLRA